MKTNLSVRIVACSAMLLVACVSASAQLVVYNFNQTGTSVSNSGTSTDPLTLVNASGVATDLHTADALGVSGQPGDRAFDNSASTGMGNAGTGGVGKSTTAIGTDLGGLKSFTIQGWYKTEGTAQIGTAAQLVSYLNGSNGFLLNAPNTGNLSLSVNGVSAFGSGSAYGATSTWTFFAVTYDGIATSNNVKFYVGSTSSAVALAYTLTLNGGTMNSPGAISLGIGNGASSQGRPFDGLIDDIRIYGSTTDTTGVLSLSALESIRSLDVVPEPGIVGLVIGAFALLVVFKHRQTA